MGWVTVGIAVVGAVTSIAGGISGSKAAKEAGKKQAAIIRAASAENQRRRRLDLNQQLGGIEATIGASNLIMSGSAEQYRSAFESNINTEMIWDKQKARMDARFAEKTGQAAAQSAMYAGAGSALQFAGTAISSMPSKPSTPAPT